MTTFPSAGMTASRLAVSLLNWLLLWLFFIKIFLKPILILQSTREEAPKNSDFLSFLLKKEKKS